MITTVFVLPEIAFSSTQANLSVQAIELKNQKGRVFFCLWKESDNGFPKCDFDSRPYAKIIVEASNARAEFVKVDSGEYSISIFHDEKSDGKVETNFLGIPRSGIGVSGEFSKPPRFSKTKFKLEGRLDLKIPVKYLLD